MKTSRPKSKPKSKAGKTSRKSRISKSSVDLTYMAHELRSPLMSIRAGMELLRRQIQQADLTKIIETFMALYPQILKQTERLDKVSREVLDFRKSLKK